MASDGFTPIISIFYAVFHPTEGTKILHQVPQGAIAVNNCENTDALFNFDTVKNYVIPKPQLCDRLISFKIDRYKVIGYPVNICDSIYARNSFSFNFCFVFPYDSDTTPYELCIRRTSKMFRVLEEQSYMLSKLDKEHSFFKEKKPKENLIPEPQQSLPGFFKLRKITLSSVESLIDQICQDLNNYSECCIPLDSANSVDIKLFPVLPPPLNIKAYQVPISTVNLEQLVDVNWDPTMLKILPHINGINSIKKISQLADADYALTKQCIQHFMHYKCLEIIDIFQFSNIYAPTNDVGNFLKLPGLAGECQAYVVSDKDMNNIPTGGNHSYRESASTSFTSASVSKSASQSNSYAMQNSAASPPLSLGLSVSPLNKSYLQRFSNTGTPKSTNLHVPTIATLFYLYRSLNQGQTVKEWYLQQRKFLNNIDIRRFFNFGILHGLIYRVYSYPILNKSIENNSNELNELVESLRMERCTSSSTTSTLKESIYMPINESNNKSMVKTGRKVSFNYNIEKPRFSLHGTDKFRSDIDQNSNNDNGSEVIDGNESNDIFVKSAKEKNQYIILIKLLKGYQHFDSICTELEKPRSEVEKMIQRLGSYSIINC